MIPIFAAPQHLAGPAGDSLTRTQAAALLGISPTGVDKLLKVGLFPTPIATALVLDLAARPRLEVLQGALTVLRTSPPSAASEGDGRRIGAHLDMADDELTWASLGSWRCDPAVVLANELFAVSVSTIPLAVLRVTGAERPVRFDDGQLRHRFTGELLARLDPDLSARVLTAEAALAGAARQILTSRVSVSSGGPIGYLAPGATPADAPA
jgi:hypothetical protein